MPPIGLDTAGTCKRGPDDGDGNWFKLLEREEISIDAICLRFDGDILNDEEYANYKKILEAR